MHKGKYVYCFIQGRFNEEINISGMGNYGKVYFIKHEDITAAVSDTPLIAFDPSRKNAIKHETIIQDLMKHCDLVPCSFGNVFKSADDLNIFIKETYKYILANLEKVKGKMEVGLRLFWKKDTFAEEIETEEIKELRNSILSQGDNNSYFVQMELGKMVEEQVDNCRQKYVDNIYNPIAQNVVEAKLSEPSNPLMVFNAAFLIWKDKEEEFDSIVGKYIEKYSDKLDFSYSGPWPPYNFTDIVPES